VRFAEEPAVEKTSDTSIPEPKKTNVWGVTKIPTKEERMYEEFKNRELSVDEAR
jgi:hypothetical protein